MTLHPSSSKNNLISHASSSSCFDLSQHQERIKNMEKTTLSKEETLNLLNQLASFKLGRFLLKNKGLDGFWTAYIILHGPQKKNLSPLENWILHSAPVVKATQERFKIFQKILQKNLKSNTTLASIPCGLMDDLLTLEFDTVSNVKLVGIDLDDESLKLAKENAQEKEYKDVAFFKKDAWDLNKENTYDIITSNGLNIYEKEDAKVEKLYKEFHTSLKPDGIFITSFLTPPPALSKDSPWQNVNESDLVKQKALFADIIQAGWQSFRTEEKTRKQLESAGFVVLEVIYDTSKLFPTIVAQKPTS